MRIEIREPTRITLEDCPSEVLDQIRARLSYIDKRIEFQYKKAKKSAWMQERMGQEAFEEHLKTLRESCKQSVLFEPDGKSPWTHSGLASKIEEITKVTIPKTFDLPEPASVPWAIKPDFALRPYQRESADRLREQGHGGVSLATGSGKSKIILTLAREVGGRTVVMCPSRSIARQLYREFCRYLGRAKVGLYGDGTKQVGRQFTIAIDDSLARVAKGTPARDWFSGADHLIVDESHLTPAKTLQAVCLELLAGARRRSFFSATQFRNDGLDLVLEGIVGPIVKSLTVKEGVDQGYLARPIFTMIGVQSSSPFKHSDVNKMTQAHLLRNPAVYDRAAGLINQAVKHGDPVLVLVEEVDQFQPLLMRIKGETRFAHGPLTSGNRDSVPKDHWASDPDALVEAFNDGKYPVLVGTSCISTGTDLRVPRMLVRIKGGASEIEVHQDVGRGTRLAEGKRKCFVIDFDVTNIPEVHRHAQRRAQIYDDIYPEVRRL